MPAALRSLTAAVPARHGAWTPATHSRDTLLSWLSPSCSDTLRRPEPSHDRPAVRPRDPAQRPRAAPGRERPAAAVLQLRRRRRAHLLVSGRRRHQEGESPEDALRREVEEETG
ncbi:hypothetical protein NKH77_43695 [Streptomyces sp. M19]